MKVSWKLSLLALILWNAGAQAADQRRITYQGRIARPDKTYFSGITPFVMKIYSPTPSSCLLWAETKDVEVVAGAFQVEIGDLTSRFAGDEGGGATDFFQVFINNSNLFIPSTECAPPFTGYQVSLNDDRILQVLTRDRGQWVLAYNGPIKAVPFALETVAIAGYTADYLLKNSGGGGADKAQGIFAQSATDHLWEISHNHDYSGSPLTNIGAPSGPDDATNKNYVDGLFSLASRPQFVFDTTGTVGAFTSAGSVHTLAIPMASTPGAVGGLISNAEYLQFTSGSISASRIDGMTFGTVTRIDAGIGLEGGAITGRGTISLATTGVLAGTVGNSAYIPQIGFDIYGRIVSVGSAAIAFPTSTYVGGNGIQISNVGGTTMIASNGQASNASSALIMRDGSGNFAASSANLTSLQLSNAGSSIVFSAPMGANYSMLLPASAGSFGQVLTTDGTNNLSWVDVSLDASRVTSGTFALARLGAVLLPGGVMQLANGSASAPGLSFLSDPSSGIFSLGVNQIGLSTSGTLRMAVDAGGRVGVGTATPRAALDVNGAIVGRAAVTSGGTLDFASSNMQTTSSSCQSFALHNLKSGGSYTFVVQGSLVALCAFSSYSDSGLTALTNHMPLGHGLTLAFTHTMYKVDVLGTHAYFTWTPGY